MTAKITLNPLPRTLVEILKSLIRIPSKAIQYARLSYIYVATTDAPLGAREDEEVAR